MAVLVAAISTTTTNDIAADKYNPRNADLEHIRGVVRSVDFAVLLPDASRLRLQN